MSLVGFCDKLSDLPKDEAQSNGGENLYCAELDAKPRKRGNGLQTPAIEFNDRGEDEGHRGRWKKGKGAQRLIDRIRSWFREEFMVIGTLQDRTPSDGQCRWWMAGAAHKYVT